MRQASEKADLPRKKPGMWFTVYKPVTIVAAVLEQGEQEKDMEKVIGRSVEKSVNSISRAAAHLAIERGQQPHDPNTSQTFLKHTHEKSARVFVSLK